MLVSEPTGLLDDSDRQRVNFFLQQQQKMQQKAQKLLPKLPHKGDFAEVSKLDADAAIALGLLHRSGDLIWHTPFTYEIINLPNHSSRLKQPVGAESAIAKMQDFISLKGDRWKFLLNAFDFEQ